MKALGLLVVALGGALAYLIGWKCYTVRDFGQEVANFVNLPIAGLQPGDKVTPPT